MTMLFEKGRALVTGASQGLGKAFAEELAARGMDLALVALPDSGLPELASLLRKNWKVEVDYLEIDLVGDAASERVADWLGTAPLRLLVNNAGIGSKCAFLETSAADSETLIKLNVLALVKLTRLLAPRLQAAAGACLGAGALQGAGILNVASLAAYYPMPYLPVYSPSKAFVVNFSLALREELRAKGVKVSVVCPSGIRTNRESRTEITKQGLAAAITCMYPDEVARAALRGLEADRAIITPGVINAVLRSLAAFAPKSLYLRVVKRFWGPDEKKTLEAAS